MQRFTPDGTCEIFFPIATDNGFKGRQEAGPFSPSDILAYSAASTSIEDFRMLLLTHVDRVAANVQIEHESHRKPRVAGQHSHHSCPRTRGNQAQIIDLIFSAMERNNYNLSAAARDLNWVRSTVAYYIDKYQIPRNRASAASV